MAISDIMFAFTVLFVNTGEVVQYKFNYNYTLRDDFQLQTQYNKKIISYSHVSLSTKFQSPSFIMI